MTLVAETKKNDAPKTRRAINPKKVMKQMRATFAYLSPGSLDKK